ncbi:hypothetical protein [Bradyrhizobium sp. RDI18]|uniref:hypothetical protein n=1 Tax=Bradyrhizobium sp. RDI18 TaxID=3367400 RepID=UPI00371659E5
MIFRPSRCQRPQLFFDRYIAERLAAADQDHARIDLALPDAAAMRHHHLTVDFLAFAGGATNTFAARKQADAGQRPSPLRE